MPTNYDLFCGHGEQYRFTGSYKDTACSICSRDRCEKNYISVLNERRVYEEARQTIPLDAAPGLKVVLWYLHWGYAADQKRLAKHGLKFGRVYTVKRMDVFSAHTDVYLEEFLNIPFNHVNFGIATPGDILDHSTS